MTNNTNPNPHRIEPHVLEAIDKTSLKMYDVWYDLLADYGFDFTLEEKKWALKKIFDEITLQNELAEEG